jgi:hypothetical protein
LNFALRAIVLLVPCALLLVGIAHTGGTSQQMLLLGAVFELLLLVVIVPLARHWHQPLVASVICLYLVALSWIWIGTAELHDWYPHFAQGFLMIVPLGLFAIQTLGSSGAPAFRRARLLAQRLANRKDWPSDLSACRDLPEVKALREALHADAVPVLGLLEHASVPVRVSALAALEYRKKWRPGQAEHVLEVAQKSTEPAVRAAAVYALANVDDRLLVETLANFLRDPSWKVRRAATEALLWDSEHRWSWIRHAIRQALADPAHQNDGPLQYDGQRLTPEAVQDLNAWVAEKGVLAVRSAQTLFVHYTRVLNEQPDDAMIQLLRSQVADPHAPAALRMELARLLQNHKRWDDNLLDQLLDPANPAPLRLMAAEALLTQREHAKAVTTLHDVAQLPNREIALATARIVQRYLNVDLGLPFESSLPDIHSRQAAEVTRRVMMWAAQKEPAVSATS